MTKLLFREDAYLRECGARVLEIRDGGESGTGIILDATVFYGRGGGQPGDAGELILSSGDGAEGVEVADAFYDRADGALTHILKNPADAEKLRAGAEVRCAIDWARRYRLMRTHTAMHILYACAKGAADGVTGSAVGELRGRLDFDMPDPPDREKLEAEANELAGRDLAVGTQWITAEELRANPELSPGAPPPKSGDIRLVEIPGADIQACGGTHLRRTGETGRIRVAKIEKKGKRNRRIVIELEE